MVEQSSDLFNKMEFFFNQINTSRDQSHRQTMDAINPVNRFLEYMRNKLDDIEKNRINRENIISNTLNNLSKTQECLKNGTEDLKEATQKMLNAFKNPSVKGRWGETQLKKIAEITGMLPFCEFELQKEIGDVRPDMVVNLPNGGYLFIDAKAPIESYLQIQEDNNAKSKKDHLKLFKSHIYGLSSKKYWTKCTSPELVVMFIPIEGIWIAALEEDPSLIEYATEKNVIVSTPMTLIGLLKTIFFGWEQVHIAKESEELKKVLLDVNRYMIEIKSALNSSSRHIEESSLSIKKCFTIMDQANNDIEKISNIDKNYYKDNSFINKNNTNNVDNISDIDKNNTNNVDNPNDTNNKQENNDAIYLS